ncbi:SRPBCC family protein [Allosphingosinicella deserti]|uniref:ATPase n=1 Tax=Allosphingosinicella deserti TaxID=2116704 RepID=A0A2P7QZD9_9SPHN|nr:SRPBCC family protein [Sphingomonas deserti]PSJ43325.1 ATPase [Sphingomonas deserti]
MPATVEAKTVHEFKASAERVFDAWLDPAKVRSWAAQPVPGMPAFDIRKVEIDARVGGKFTFSDMREDGEAVHWGYYLEIDRPHRLVFSWFTSEEEEEENNSTVTLTIEPIENGCRATIVHRMDERWADYIGPTANAWSFMLQQIEQDFETGAGGA